MATQTTPVSANRQKARNRWILIVGTIGFALLGAAVGHRIGGMLKSAGPLARPQAWIIAVFPVTIFLAVALHEAGHVVGGLASGFRFYLFVAGPLRISRCGERLKFSFNRVLSLWGGMAACVSQEYGQASRGSMIRYMAGGPAFSLLGATALLPAYALRTTNPNLAWILVMFGLVSAMLALATLIPLHLGGTTTDGGRLLMLLRNRPEGRRWTALAAVAGLSLAERPKHWPAELVEVMSEGTDATPDAVFTCLLRHSWHLDRREWQAAGVWLERALGNIEAVAEPARGGIYIAAAYFQARHGQNVAMAREYLGRAAKRGLHDPDAMHLADAAVLIAEGRRTEAGGEPGTGLQDVTDQGGCSCSCSGDAGRHRRVARSAGARAGSWRGPRRRVRR